MAKRELVELFRGKGAHVDPIACVEDISAEFASQQIAGFPHSIGQVVFHLNFWMNYDLRRIRGEKPAYPDHAAESWAVSPCPTDGQHWDRIRRDFAWFLAEYVKLAETSPAELAREIEPLHDSHKKIANTLEALLWQSVAHLSYHVGQIALLRRVLGAWPPRQGGDTW